MSLGWKPEIDRRLGHHSLWQSRLFRLVYVALAGACGLALVLGLALHWDRRASDLDGVLAKPDGSVVPAAYLYRLDANSGAFLTITLPVNSRPAAVSVVSDSLRQWIWFSEPGLNRLGLVVYTSSLDYALTEFDVGASPVSVAASDTQVWFTLPAQNQVGRLDIASGVLNAYDLPSAQADPADIAIGFNGQVWITERRANRLALVTISPTVAITEYVLPANGLMPEGVLPAEDGSVWFASSSTGYLWRLLPETGEYLVSPPLGPNSQPYRLALNRPDHVWATLKNTNQLVCFTAGSLASTELYTVPTSNSQPTDIEVSSLGYVYFVEQSAAQIGRLVTTPTVSFGEYPVPQSDLKLTGLGVAGDGAVWTAAYRVVYQVFGPLALVDYQPGSLPFAVQMYGGITAANGFTHAVAAGVRTIRFPVSWSSIEPSNTTPGNYNWNDLDASVQTASLANVQLILTIDGNPSWAAARSRGPVSNTADLQQFVGAMVARYPQVRYWEFYNEPDHRDSFGSNGAAYAAMLQGIYPVVKSANPDAQVVMGGVALDWFTDGGGPFDRNFLDSVLSHCTGQCFDVANFHYYPFFRGVWEPYGHDIIGKANYVSQTLVSHGYNRPLINTETGWPSASTWGSPELQARYVPKAYVRALAAGLAAANWYALLDSDTSNPGLLTPDLRPRPALTAYQTLVSMTRRARYVRAIPSTETGSTYIEGYQFSVPNSSGQKRLDVYWYDCPSLYQFETVGIPTDCNDGARLLINAYRIAVIDKMKNSKIVNDADDGQADGKVTIPDVGSSPIYVDYAP